MTTLPGYQYQKVFEVAAVDARSSRVCSPHPQCPPFLLVRSVPHPTLPPRGRTPADRSPVWKEAAFRLEVEVGFAPCRETCLHKPSRIGETPIDSTQLWKGASPVPGGCGGREGLHTGLPARLGCSVLTVPSAAEPRSPRFCSEAETWFDDQEWCVFCSENSYQLTRLPPKRVRRRQW